MKKVEIGEWVVRKQKEIAYPGKVTCVVGDLVIFKIFDAAQTYESHAKVSELRPAIKSDFDRQISDLSKDMLMIEMTINKLHNHQKEVVE